MEIAKSNVVEATAGRDKGKYFFVMSENEDFLFLADGKYRRIEAPKRKKRRHVRLVEEGSGRVAEKIRNSEKVTNSELRRAIDAYGGAGKRSGAGGI